TFTVTLEKATTESFTLNFKTQDRTATLADNDYQADNNTLAFAGTAGEMKSINVKVNGDLHLEKDEIFELVLQQLSNNFNNRLTIPINIAEGVILNDDDALITITKADGQEGGNMASFTFSFPTGVVTDE